MSVRSLARLATSHSLILASSEIIVRSPSVILIWTSIHVPKATHKVSLETPGPGQNHQMLWTSSINQQTALSTSMLRSTSWVFPLPKVSQSSSHELYNGYRLHIRGWPGPHAGACCMRKSEWRERVPTIQWWFRTYGECYIWAAHPIAPRPWNRNISDHFFRLFSRAEPHVNERKNVLSEQSRLRIGNDVGRRVVVRDNKSLQWGIGYMAKVEEHVRHWQYHCGLI